MYEMPKCTCGEELEFDMDDGLECDGDVASMLSFGHCPKCGKEYKWYDYYTLSHYMGLKEIK